MYDNKYAQRVLVGTVAPIALATAGVAGYSYTLFERARLTRISIYITTAVSSTGPVQIQVLQRPVSGSATNQLVIGTLNIPANTVNDKIVYKDVTPVNLNMGDQIAFNVLTPATTGGAGFCEFIADFSPEVPANQSKMVLSA